MMAGFTGDNEAEAILARLKTLAGGRFTEGQPDSEPTSAQPYGYVSFGEPIPTTRGRGVGAGEQDQPHLLPVSVTSVAYTEEGARLLSSGVNKLLIGWTPDQNNAGELRGVTGSKFTTPASQTSPTRWFRVRYLECTIGLESA